MKPLELLEYLEEVVDTRHYQEPIAQLDERIAAQSEVKIQTYKQFNECQESFIEIEKHADMIIHQANLRSRLLYLQNLEANYERAKTLRSMGKMQENLNQYL